jgi:excinuclease ABC subunit C
MEKFRFLKKEEVSGLPKTPGVYSFKKERSFLYIGKAINIKERVKSHSQKSNYKDNLFIDEVRKIGYIKTDSEIEALVLEANLIKKYKPKYNVVWKDDKNFFFVAVTKEAFPRVFITHQTNIRSSKFIGPFVDGAALKKTLKLLRRIFPYYTIKKHPDGLCSWCHLNLCPGPNPNKKDYKKNINNLISVLKGKRKSVLLNLKKEMKSFSESQNYERAAEIRDQISALENILSHAKIIGGNPPAGGWKKTEESLKKILGIRSASRRTASWRKKISYIEAYDVSNIQGQKATGSMITFARGEPDKNLYRKFKIKISGSPNDIAMLKEVLERRFNHPEWKIPDLILIDGGMAQLNIAIKTKNRESKTKGIKVMAIAKKKNELYIEDRKKPFLLENLPREIFNLILKMRDESHRFAINYHKKLREKDLFI